MYHITIHIYNTVYNTIHNTHINMQDTYIYLHVASDSCSKLTLLIKKTSIS